MRALRAAALSSRRKLVELGVILRVWEFVQEVSCQAFLLASVLCEGGKAVAGFNIFRVVVLPRKNNRTQSVQGTAQGKTELCLPIAIFSQTGAIAADCNAGIGHINL